MLVLAGRVVELDAHIARLSAGVAALYASELPAETRALAVDGAAGIERGKLRLAFVPGEHEAELRLDAEEVEAAALFPGTERGIGLRPVTVVGGLGEYKWVDRRLLDRAAATMPAGDLPLLLDADGSVLEASRASVFAVLDGRVVTPAIDGRILPSIARAQAIEAAIAAGVGVREAPLTLAELRSAEVFLTGSVRGVEPVVAVDGRASAPPGEISTRIAAGLRSRWLREAATEPVAAGAGGPPDGPHGR